MPARNRPFLTGVLALLLAGSSLTAQSSPPPDAAAAEKAGRWEQSLELYLRAYLGGRQTPDVRQRIQDCARRAAQARRHRDPAFRHFVTSLDPSAALDLYAEVVQKLAATYADRDRCTPAALFRLGLDELDRAAADPAFRRQHAPDATPEDVAAFRKATDRAREGKPPATARACRQAVLDLLPVAGRVLKVRDASAVVFEFLCGACTGLDEYTVYLSPDRVRTDLTSPIVDLAAYGVLIAFRDGEVVIDGIVPDSYAALHTPLRPGDRIVRANGRPLQPASPIALAEALRNPLDGVHELDTLSPTGMAGGGKVMLPVPVPTVLRADLLDPKEGVGYVRLAAFRETTAAELDQAIQRLRERGMPLRALVLDLRGNAGGHFTAGVQVAERFVPAGILVTTRGQAAEVADRVFSSASGMTAVELPVVLLVDTRTMSAAEIVAAALKGHDRAVVVGMPTFGKGVVQCPVRLPADDARPAGSGLLIVTIAKAFAPAGEPIHGVGVLPHVVEADPPRQLAVALERAAALANGMR